MNKNIKKGIIATALATSVAVLNLSGCAQISSVISAAKGSLVGNSYTIYAYDNFGNQVMEVSGKRVSLETKTDNEGNDSSYLEITIDGNEWDHVGNTLVFVEDGADMITDFSEDINIDSNSGSTGIMGIDRSINKFKNSFGQSSVVAVYSQAGVPITLLQGDNCYEEIPSDLPKMTRLHIDGKSVYVYKANIDIIPSRLIK